MYMYPLDLLVLGQLGVNFGVSRPAFPGYDDPPCLDPSGKHLVTSPVYVRELQHAKFGDRWQ